MEIKFSVTGKERKALVAAIAQILGAESKYLGVPSCAYAIDEFTVDKDGTLLFGDRTDSDVVENLLEALNAQGFTAEAQETPQFDETEPEGVEPSLPEASEPATMPEDTSEAEPEPAGEEARLTIEISTDHFDAQAIQNLNKIIESKGSLLKKALGVDNLDYEVTDTSVKFPWFSLEGILGEANAYAQFAEGLMNMVLTSKRITAKPKEVENEKFAFRVFLIRLGLVGEEYKLARKLLLKRLTGNSAFKGGAKKDVSE